MDNIKYYSENVKHFSEKEQKQIVVQSYISTLFGNDFAPIKSAYINADTEFRFYRTSQDTVKGCPLDMPKSLTYGNAIITPKQHKRHKLHFTFAQLYDCARNGNIPNIVLAKAYQKQLKKSPLIRSVDGKGATHYFRGAIKGMPAYNKKYKYRLWDWCDALQSLGGYFYFLTITYSPNQHGIDIIQAWKTFKKQLDTLFNQLRKAYGIEYASVCEATTKGYPHAHIILQSAKPLHDTSKKYKGGDPIFDGQFREYLVEHVPSPIFKLQYATTGGLKGYLAKYVSKTKITDVSKFIKNPTKVSKEWRKALASCILPVASGVRQFQCSRPISRLAQQKQESYLETKKREPQQSATISSISSISRASMPEYEVLGQYVAPWATGEALKDLIVLLTNSACPVVSSLKILSKKSDKALKAFETALETGNAKEIEQHFKQNGIPLKCKGCFLSFYLEKMQNKPEIIDNLLTSSPVYKSSDPWKENLQFDSPKNKDEYLHNSFLSPIIIDTFSNADLKVVADYNGVREIWYKNDATGEKTQREVDRFMFNRHVNHSKVVIAPDLLTPQEKARQKKLEKQKQEEQDFKAVLQRLNEKYKLNEPGVVHFPDGTYLTRDDLCKKYGYDNYSQREK